MKISSILAILVVLIYAGLEISTLHTQRYRTEPLFIHGQFVSADHATERCGEPEAEERARFRSNFRAVQRNALEDLQEDSPDATEESLRRRLDELAATRVMELDALIDSNGCSDPEVRRFVKLHEVRSRLNLK